MLLWIVTLPELTEFLTIMICDHSWFSWLPLCWADLSMFIYILECLNQSNVRIIKNLPQNLIYTSANWEIIDWVLSQYTLSVNYECSSKCYSIIRVCRVFNEYSIVFGYFLECILSKFYFTLLTSASNGMFMSPSPPYSLEVLQYFMWLNWESMDTPMTSVFIFLNSYYGVIVY